MGPCYLMLASTVPSFSHVNSGVFWYTLGQESGGLRAQVGTERTRFTHLGTNTMSPLERTAMMRASASVGLHNEKQSQCRFASSQEGC